MARKVVKTTNCVTPDTVLAGFERNFSSDESENDGISRVQPQRVYSCRILTSESNVEKELESSNTLAEDTWKPREDNAISYKAESSLPGPAIPINQIKEPGYYNWFDRGGKYEETSYYCGRSTVTRRNAAYPAIEEASRSV
jgi:hypothetical protein